MSAWYNIRHELFRSILKVREWRMSGSVWSFLFGISHLYPCLKSSESPRNSPSGFSGYLNYPKAVPAITFRRTGQLKTVDQKIVIESGIRHSQRVPERNLAVRNQVRFWTHVSVCNILLCNKFEPGTPNFPKGTYILFLSGELKL